MQYEKILKLSLAPTVLLFLISFVSVILTIHYWIIGDWIMGRWFEVPTKDFDARTKTYRIDDTIVYYTDPDSDATITSGALSLTAAVIGLMAWQALRKPGMDADLMLTKRRWWILAVSVMTTASMLSALSALILHYTERGDDEYGCKSETLMMAGKMNTNLFCTREFAACNFAPKFIGKDNKWKSTIACNEAVAVKWLQIIIILCSAVVFGMFSSQAWIRRKTRPARISDDKLGSPPP